MPQPLKLLFLLVSLLLLQPTQACSIFTCSRNGQVLVGANEDGSTSVHYLWFVPATKGKYGAVYFGQTNMQTQAGMNEHGLFFDFAAIPQLASDNREIKFISLADILSTCKTVDEALKLYQTHTYASFGSQMLLADATGNSVLINADTIFHKTGDYQITTNFNVCNLSDKNYDCLRYDKIDQTLSANRKISIPLFQNILEDVHQEGGISTQYSNVYDLKNKKVYINWFHNFRETLVINLQEELEKGFQIKNMGNQFRQTSFAAHAFQSSEENMFYYSLLSAFEEQGPETGLKLYEAHVAAHPDLADQARDQLNWIPYGLIAKARTAHDNVSFDFYYIPMVQTYKPLWRSDHELLVQSLEILEYIRDHQLIDSEFHLNETEGYIHMVLGNTDSAVAFYEQAIAVAEKDSREHKRATRMLEIIQNNRDEELKYLKQSPPSVTPEKFAPGIISKGNEYEFGSVFNSKGTEFYYGVNVNGKEEIRYSRLENETWSQPIVLLQHPDYGYNDPFLSPDENRLYCISQRPKKGQDQPGDYDIWYVEKKGAGWSEPINAGPNINSSRNEYYISFTRTGTMYFSSNKQAPQNRTNDFDIYASKQINGKFQPAVVLGEAINTPEYEADVFIDPDENYMIYCAQRTGGLGEGDLYISFKQADGIWSASKNMGAPINSAGHELCPYVTADGKYLFYTSNQDIYWVSTEILEKYR